MVHFLMLVCICFPAMHDLVFLELKLFKPQHLLVHLTSQLQNILFPWFPFFGKEIHNLFHFNFHCLEDVKVADLTHILHVFQEYVLFWISEFFNADRSDLFWMLRRSSRRSMSLWFVFTAHNWRSWSFTVFIEYRSFTRNIVIWGLLSHVSWCASSIFGPYHIDVYICKTADLLSVWNPWALLAVLFLLFCWIFVLFWLESVVLLLTYCKVWILVVWALVYSVLLKQFGIWILGACRFCNFYIDWMIIKLSISQCHVMMILRRRVGQDIMTLRPNCSTHLLVWLCSFQLILLKAWCSLMVVCWRLLLFNFHIIGWLLNWFLFLLQHFWFAFVVWRWLRI